jgi:threonine/homoserine/homoserine lactone efflux protein
MIRSGRKRSQVDRLPPAPLDRIYWQGMVTNILNPKVALFYMSFMPQFVDTSAGSVPLQIGLLGVIFNVNGTLVLVAITLLFGYVGGWLERRPLFWRVQRYVSGSILVGLGLSLALPDRR